MMPIEDICKLIYARENELGYERIGDNGARYIEQTPVISSYVLEITENGKS